VGALVAADEAKARGEELTLLLDATRALSTERELGKLFAQFHALVGGVMDARSFLIAIGSAEHGRMQFPYVVSEGQQLDVTEAPFGDSLCGHVFTHGKPLLMRRLEDFEAYPGGVAGEGPDILSAVYAPMRIND